MLSISNPFNKKKSKIFFRSAMKNGLMTSTGLLLICISLFLKYHYNNRLSFTVPVEKIVSPIQDTNDIASIHITKLLLTLPVFETTINNGTWEIANEGASHLGISGAPGADTNIVIYAHNSLDKFGALRDLHPGDKVQLTTDDGLTHEYMIDKTHEVTPTNIEIISPTQEEILTLYTCSGIADTKRFVVHAKPTTSVSYRIEK
ncbi:sortase [Patescibacteria group bacterium]